LKDLGEIEDADLKRKSIKEIDEATKDIGKVKLLSREEEAEL
jgi:hypothetical protein